MAETWHPVTDIAALRDAIAWPHPTDDSSTTIDPSYLRQLAEHAKATVWDSLPLCAIAEAHKKKGDIIMARGDPNANAANASAVYVEYRKYLQLYPHKKDEEYKKISRAVYLLEQALGRASEENELSAASPIDPHTESTSPSWTFLCLGLLAAAVVPFVLRRVSDTHV
ncbi:hypothetical protein DFH09DRAFT_1201213 [Mycena vulgaris]|nr:hypothetical protein DFH09DRAFT_1201213 [Mycena vulgaris]